MENKSETKILFTEKEFDDVTKYLIGNNVRLYPNLIVPQTCGKMKLFINLRYNHCPPGPARILSTEEKMMQSITESCPFRAGMSGVMGGALGGFMGLFNSSIAPHHTHQMTTRETLIDMKNSIVSSARGFAFIGLIFAGNNVITCCISTLCFRN